MERRKWMAGVALASGIGIVAVSGAAMAQEDPWRLRVGPLGAVSLAGGDIEPSLGAGASLEYRLSARLGVELGALTAELEEGTEVDFFGFFTLDLESRLRITPLVAKLDVHLTPESRVDFYVAPVVAYVRMSDLEVRARTVVFGEEEEDEGEVRFQTEDELTWGASVGLDVSLGGGSSFLALNVTYLRLPLRVRSVPDEVREQVGVFGDVDPLFVQVGYGLRF